MPQATPEDLKAFRQKVWIAVSIAALVVSILLILEATFNVLLLVLAGAILALYFHGLSNMLHRLTNIPKKFTLIISVLLTIALLVLFFWLTGARIQEQVKELQESLPAMIDRVKEELGKTAAGERVLEEGSSESNFAKASAVLRSFFRSTFGVLGDLYVVFFLGIFFTFGSGVYVTGAVKLAPASARDRTQQILSKSASTLQKWLKGQLFAMLIVAVLTITGLMIMGVPMAFVLGLIAGIMNFIPNFGPLLALIPALLVGLSQGPVTALLIAILYIVVQALESNLITPQIQKKLINIPPALIIISQLLMGVLTGGWGLILAMPLVALLTVVLQETYVKKEDEKYESMQQE